MIFCGNFYDWFSVLLFWKEIWCISNFVCVLNNLFKFRLGKVNMVNMFIVIKLIVVNYDVGDVLFIFVFMMFLKCLFICGIKLCIVFFIWCE